MREVSITSKLNNNKKIIGNLERYLVTLYSQTKAILGQLSTALRLP